MTRNIFDNYFDIIKVNKNHKFLHISGVKNKPNSILSKLISLKNNLDKIYSFYIRDVQICGPF